LDAPAIEVRGITKTFPPRPRRFVELLRGKPRPPPVEALRGVDLDVPRGELFGLLGPNGAGKTTLVKILATLLLPTAGVARVAGLDVARHEKEVRRLVGVVLGGDRGLYWRLTARENLRYFAQLYGMPLRRARERSDEVLGAVGLLDRGDDRVEAYSKGMKQRLHVARGLLTDPEILLLDEPTIGLDPHGARDVRALVRGLVDDEGRTVVLTTHYLGEADALSDRVGILHRGRLVTVAPPSELKARHAARGVVVVRVRGGDDLEKRLAAVAGVERVLAGAADADGTREFRLAGAVADADLAEVAAEATRGGAHLLGLRRDEPSLEDVFVELTGEGLGEGEG